MSSETHPAEEEGRQESEAPVEENAMPADREESRVMEVMAKAGAAARTGLEKARPVVVKGAKKGAHYAAVGGRKGAQLAAVGAGKAKDQFVSLWKKMTDTDPPLHEDDDQ